MFLRLVNYSSAASWMLRLFLSVNVYLPNALAWGVQRETFLTRNFWMFCRTVGNRSTAALSSTTRGCPTVRLTTTPRGARSAQDATSQSLVGAASAHLADVYFCTLFRCARQKVKKAWCQTRKDTNRVNWYSVLFWLIDKYYRASCNTLSSTSKFWV